MQARAEPIDDTPSDGAWIRVRLGDVANRGSGHTPDKKRPGYWGGSIMWVSLKDTFRLDKGLISTTTETITESGLANSSAEIHAQGSVVLLRDAGIGKGAVLASDMAVSQHFMAWTCGPRLDNWFLYYVLQYMKPEFERIANGSTIKTIGLDYFRQLTISLPSVHEQRRIAEALRTIDELIAALEHLIVKKQEIKQGVMQQLLTGRTRLPGFTDARATLTFGDFLTIQRGDTFIAGREPRGGAVPVIAAGKAPAGFAHRSNRAAPVITISSSGASAGYVAFHEQPIFASDCSTISPGTQFDLRYIFYNLVLRQEEIYHKQTGGAQPHVHARDIYPMVAVLPESVEEQGAIAMALKSADDEMGALVCRLNKLRGIKAGMMQELLTGRMRLPIDEVA